MSPRKKVISPNLLNYFYLKRGDNLGNILYFNTQIFNGFSFFVMLILLSLILGSVNTVFWAVGGSCALLLIFLYQKTSRLCHGISIERQSPTFAREKTEITISYIVTNETGFKIDSLGFREEFDGVDKGFFLVEGQAIPAHSQLKIKKKIFLNAGMGIKTISPLKISLRDELGIFDFKVDFLKDDKIEVYPFVEDSPPLKNSVSPDSLEFGLYEVAKRGDSNLFIGTREYRKGDPIRHINWKLTKKSNKVVVNEYEKSTNTYITFLLDLNIENQTGLGKKSTWEATKDIALSIAHNEIKKNNSIQVISNNLYIPFASGKDQITLFERHFTFHKLTNSGDSNYSKYLSSLPANGQVYFICPIPFSLDTLKKIELLKRLSEQGQKIIIFSINPIRELSLAAHGKLKESLIELQRNSDNDFKSLQLELEKYGIPIVPITVKEDLQLYEQIVENSKDLLEVK